MKYIKQVAYNVFLGGVCIDTVFYSPTVNTDEIRRSLISHDGYDPGIVVSEEEPDPDYLTHSERRVLSDLRNRGFAVIVWTPSELGSANPSRVQDRSIELGHDVIETLQD